MLSKIDFKSTIENAFLEYGASVAQERAIPDVRDGLKIGLRQGLYAQYSNKLTHKDKFQKAQKSVASAMAQSYVHGDQAMYNSFIAAAKPFVYRYPIEEAQGAYGTPASPDDHSASRYVEMRAGEKADYFFYGLKKKAIDEWYWNYDDTELIPSVFPSIGFWNVVNGSLGIGVALATSVPQFNLKEVNEALIKIIQNPYVSFDEIYCAPDFCGGSTILNGKEVKESLRAGKGKAIRLRANLEYLPEKNVIRATHMPHGVFTNTVISQLKELTEENEDYGISRVIDYTKKEADIRIYLSKGANPQKVIRKLYKDTSLEDYFSVNMVMLDMGRVPKVFGWREACDAYITHIRSCKTREIQFDLNKTLARINVVDGLIAAAASIDEVVSIIRGSSNPAEASSKLETRFGFNEEQTKAILAMKLSSLTKIDGVKLENEKAELTENAAHFQHLLNDSTLLDEELIKVLREVAEKFGDARRTQVLNVIEADEEEPEPPQEDDLEIMVFDNNTIRAVKVGEKKKGKAPRGVKLINTLYATNFGSLSVFTADGKMYSVPLGDVEYCTDVAIPQGTVIDTLSLLNYKYVIFLTKQGLLKKSKTKDYNVRAKKGTAAIKLRDGDSVVGVFFSSNENDRIFVASSGGYYNFYSHNDIAAIGRVSQGVKAIKMKDNEVVEKCGIVKDGDEEVCGFVISSLNETSRAIKGIKIGV